MLRQVGSNGYDFGSGLWCKAGHGQVWLVFCGDVDRFYVLVCGRMYGEDGTSGASFRLFVVRARIMDEFVSFESLSPYGLDVPMFGFRER